MTKKITIEVPADFTAEQVKEVQEFAMVKVDRILRATEVVPVAIKEANDTKVDECLLAMNLRTKFAKVEEKPVEEPKEEFIVDGEPIKPLDDSLRL